MSRTADDGERSRICCANSGPHIWGITTSDTTRSKPPLMVMISSACSGPGAVVVSYPAELRMSATTRKTTGSSSTTKILAVATLAPPGQRMPFWTEIPFDCLRFLDFCAAPTLISADCRLPEQARCSDCGVFTRSAKFEAFKRRYYKELDKHPESWKPVLDAARRETAILLDISRDTEHNNAAALKRYLGAEIKWGGCVMRPHWWGPFHFATPRMVRAEGLSARALYSK